MQAVIEISAKMFKCRELAIFLFGEEGFLRQIQKWKPCFDAARKKFNCSDLEALIKLLEAVKGKPDEGSQMLLLTAIACELTEPSLSNP